MAKAIQSEPSSGDRASPHKSADSVHGPSHGVPNVKPFNRLLAHNTLPFLQQTMGNRAVNRLIQRTLTLDNEPIQAYADIKEQDRATLINLCKSVISIQTEMFVSLIIAEVIQSSEVFVGTLKDLSTFLGEIFTAYMMSSAQDIEQLSQGTPAEKIAGSIHSGDEKIKALGQALQATSMQGIDRKNALALGELMEQYPDFKQQFGKNKAIKSLNFNSGAAKNLGGKYNRDKRSIDIETIVGAQPQPVFLRTLIHEIGHATFQQLILKDKLSEDVSKGQHGNLGEAQATTSNEIDDLANSPFQGNKHQMGPNSELHQQAQALSDLFQKEDHLKQEIAKFSDDGMAYYNAWLVLRQNDGQYMLGVDLGPVSSAQGRKPYQAKKFEEFCAESFMHIVQEPATLNEHITQLKINEDTPEEVISAWQTVINILIKYKPMILGEKAI